MKSPLNASQGQKLLHYARCVIAERLGLVQAEDEPCTDPGLTVQGGTFVTLKIGGGLRGCIGNLEPGGTISTDIRHNALGAAFHDHRFSPLTPAEFSRLHISISVLTHSAPLEYRDGDDLVARLRPGIDGVILRHGRRTATFLPQVWEQLPDPVQFLTHLCLKAGLPEGQWRSGDVEILTYQVQYFAEEDEG